MKNIKTVLVMMMVVMMVMMMSFVNTVNAEDAATEQPPPQGISSYEYILISLLILTLYSLTHCLTHTLD